MHLPRTTTWVFVVTLSAMVVGSAPIMATPPTPERARSRVARPLEIDGACARPGSFVNRCGDYTLLHESPLERLQRSLRKIGKGGTAEDRAEADKQRRLIEQKIKAMTRGGIVEELR